MASEDIIHTLKGMANLFGKDISDEGAELLIRVLEKYPPEFVMQALQRCTLELPKFPTIAEIIERMPGQHAITPDQEATLLANRIIARIGLDGYTNPHRAREKIGEQGWAVVEAWGGWTMLCGLKADQLATARAQLEKLCKSILAQGSALPGAGPVKRLGQEQALPPESPRSFAGLLEEIANRKDEP